MRIEDYALIGNCASAGLVGKNGSIDWLTLPRFDSGACFAALLGNEDNGRWLIAPVDENPQVTRRYRDGTLILETEFRTPEGVAVVVDAMGRVGDVFHVLRVVRGVQGSVPMRMDLKLRFDYGSIVPWVTRLEDGRIRAIAGPNMVVIASPVDMRGEGMASVADFTVHAGEEIPFSLAWRESHLPVPESPDVSERLAHLEERWRHWSSQHEVRGPYHEAVLRSLITLKALTNYETGGIVAAPTTSLPEAIGGARNWDYRYCWLRDATLALYALLHSGFTEEAKAWRDWLLRAVAGSPDQMQIMYGVAGERRLDEYEIPWLAGYEGSTPVRIGNAAAGQLQLDVYGEVLDLLYQARRSGLERREAGWDIEGLLTKHLADIWAEPDDGIWEVRGPRQQFTYSKVMAWVTLDRAIRTAEEFKTDYPVDQWRPLRDKIHEEVCRCGFSTNLNSFTQYYGSESLDASLLMLPLVGFLPPQDPRIKGTLAAIERDLLHDGFVKRYNTTETDDGLHGNEGAFLACSFWLADNYVLQGRMDDARTMFERLLALRNDVGLLSEEYDIVGQRLVGNFPQAFSHVGLVNTAHNLCMEEGPAVQRADGRGSQAGG
jgi:GH15 family glucan-1,4-alpha-glucosidase